MTQICFCRHAVSGYMAVADAICGCMCLQDQNGALELELADLKTQQDADVAEARQAQDALAAKAHLEVCCLLWLLRCGHATLYVSCTTYTSSLQFVPGTEVRPHACILLSRLYAIYIQRSVLLQYCLRMTATYRQHVAADSSSWQS